MYSRIKILVTASILQLDKCVISQQNAWMKVQQPRFVFFCFKSILHHHSLEDESGLSRTNMGIAALLLVTASTTDVSQRHCVCEHELTPGGV